MKRYLLLYCLSATMATMPVFAGTITLNFNSLPSTQGFSYLNDGGFLTETQVFSVSADVLEQNSIGGGTHDYAYRDPGVVADSPFEIDWTAKLIAEELSQSNNFYGFAIGVATTTQSYDLGLGAGGIDLENGDSEYIIPASSLSAAGLSLHDYHHYTMLGNIAAGTWSFFIDGTFWATGSAHFRILPIPNGILLGDITDGPNAQGDTSAFSFTQSSATPEPASFWPLAGIAAAVLIRQRAKRGKRIA